MRIMYSRHYYFTLSLCGGIEILNVKITELYTRSFLKLLFWCSYVIELL
jgi:hypothetical protein